MNVFNPRCGEVAEWSKAIDSKSIERRELLREFKSHLLRQYQVKASPRKSKNPDGVGVFALSVVQRRPP